MQSNGMQVAMARIGTAIALGFPVPIARATGIRYFSSVWWL